MSAKDFDVERRRRLHADRTFIVGNQEWRHLPEVRPEALFDFASLETATLGPDAMAIVDRMIEAVLDPDYPEPGAVERWRRARNVTGDETIGMATLTALAQWLMEQVTGSPLDVRPTSAPGSTTQNVTTVSTAPSDSLVVTSGSLTPAPPATPPPLISPAA